MKKIPCIALAAIALTGLVFIQSCEKDSAATPQEFVADNNSFSGFLNWPLDKSFNGPDPLLGALAHGNNDSTVVRDVHFKNGQDPVNSKYPVGTLIVKYSHNTGGSLNEYTAMAKRGNNYNSDGGDWEYFMLSPAGNIANDVDGSPMRGANLMGGMCAGCHAGASSKDFVFSK